MKAILCKSYGTPDDLVLEQIGEPALGDRQVRIRVAACGVNFPDVLMIAGKYQMRPPMPFTPGAEISGEVVEVGASVSHIKIGQRVLALCGYGGMAEQACVDEHAVIPIPDTMQYETAAAFLMTYGTSYHALKQRADIQPGESLLVLGAAGGVGLAAVELGNKMGAEVIAAASSAKKLGLAEQYGARHCINYSDSSLKEAVKEITEGRGVDVIYDPVGGALFDDCLRSIAWKGRILVIGFAGGEIQSMPANLVLLKGSSIVGVFWGKFTEREPEVNRRNTMELLEMHGAGQLTPHISDEFALEDAAGALKTLKERRALGKIIVKISL
jgi:NADPH2:quinone reductase